MRPIYLYIVPFFPSHECWRGGFFLDAVKAMLRDGRYDVKVMVAGIGGDYEFEGIKVHGFKRYSIGGADYFSLLSDRLKLFSFSRKLREMGVSVNDIAVCHVHLVERMGLYATWMKKRNPRCLTLLHHHWSGLYGYPGGRMVNNALIRVIEYMRIRRDYQLADAHVFCSRLTRELFDRIFPNYTYESGVEARLQLPLGRYIPPLKYRDSYVCYNGIDNTVFSPVGENSKTTSEYRIGCVANFLPAKSQITLLMAVNLIRNEIGPLKVIFVGSGRCFKQCQEYVARENLGDVVEFKNEMYHTLLPGFYRSLDLYVQPSCFEAFNCTLVEALGCGVPVIATTCISFKEVVEKGAWEDCLFVPKDENDLAGKIMKFYRNRHANQVPRLTVNLGIDNTIGRFLDWVTSIRKI